MNIGQWVKCNACGGAYMPLQPDSSQYFHVCPERVLVAAAQTDPVTGKVIAPAQVRLIQGRRDERVVSNDGKGNVVIVSEGRGVTPIPAPPIAVPGDPVEVVP